MMCRHQKYWFAALFLYSTGGLAAEYDVGQKNKAFTTLVLKVNVGDSVSFSNQDPFFHNIYSMSSTKSFDLGSYPRGERRSVKFESVGTVVVQCAIHPVMKMEVRVIK